MNAAQGTPASASQADPTVYVSVFATLTSTTAALAESMTWRQVVASLLDGMPVFEPAHLTPKTPGSLDYEKPADLPLIAFTKFRDGVRSRSNVEAVYALGYDYDGEGATLENARSAFPGLLGAVHASFNDRPDKPALRVLLVASRPMTADEYDRCWAVGQRKLGAGQGSEAKDAPRWFYIPAAIEGRPVPAATLLEGVPFEVDAWLAEGAAPAPAPAPTPKQVKSDDYVHPSDDGYEAAIARARELCRKHPLSLRKNSPARETTPDGCTGEDRLLVLMGDLRFDCELAFDDARRILEEEYQPRHLESDRWNDVDEVWRKYDEAHVKNRTPLRSPAHPSKLLAKFSKASNDHEQSATAPAGIFTFGGWHEAPEPKVYLVDGYIAKGSVNNFFGKGGHMKTWAALDLGLAVAKGATWLGKHVTRKGKVGYLDFESDREEIHNRVHLLAGQDAKDFGYVQGHSLGAHLHDATFWGKLEASGLDLLIVDSLRAGSSGVSENGDEAAEPLILAGKFAVRTGCTVIFIHHAGKAENGDERGYSGIRDQADASYKFEKPDDDATVTRMSNTKPNGRKPEDLKIEFQEGKPLFIAGQESEDGGKTPHAKNVEKAKELQIRVIKSVRKLEGKTAPTMKQIATDVGARPKGVGAVLKDCVEQQLLYHADPGYRVDTEGKRELRIVETIRGAESIGGTFTSVTELMRKSKVRERDIDRMVLAGQLVRGGDNVRGTFHIGPNWKLGFTEITKPREQNDREKAADLDIEDSDRKWRAQKDDKRTSVQRVEDIFAEMDAEEAAAGM